MGMIFHLTAPLQGRGALLRPDYEGDFFRFPKALTTMATTETR